VNPGKDKNLPINNGEIEREKQPDVTENILNVF
jgi:hypothetical protein